jgi:hypothetical protein
VGVSSGHSGAAAQCAARLPALAGQLSDIFEFNVIASARRNLHFAQERFVASVAPQVSEIDHVSGKLKSRKSAG